MKRVLVILAAMGLFLFLVAADKAAPKDSYQLPAKNGTVTLNHKAHVDHAGKKCATCHHGAKDDGAGAKKCDECHGKDAKAPAMKDAMHKNCKGCHEKNKEKAPIKCDGCHKKGK
jgi:hypothetical protein